MTPKEKAEELFSTYRYALSIPNAPLGENKDNVAKQCAFIAVDEILTSFSRIFDDYVINPSKIGGYRNMKEYWREVRTEIEKLLKDE